MGPPMIRLRRVWFQIHKWIGIVLALLIIPLSLSGAALVWHDWIDRQVHPQRYTDDGTAVLAPSAYAENGLRLARPGEPAAGSRVPRAPAASPGRTLIRSVPHFARAT